MLWHFGSTRSFRRLFGIPACGALLLLCGRTLAQTGPAVPPVPEQYEGRYSAYAVAAEGFIRDHADSPAAPRCAMDLLVTATTSGDQTTAAKMRIVLVGDYPTSAQGKYFINSLSDVSQFVQIMSEVADQNFENMQQDFAARFDVAMRMGVQRFGLPALGDGGQLVRVALITGAAQDTQLLQASYAVLANGGSRLDFWRRILLTATSKDPSLKRLSQLHAMSIRQAAIPFEMLLLNHLTPDEKTTTDAQTIETDDLLQLGRMTDALPLLEKLCDAPNPDARLLFWKAWATAANGDALAGQKMLRDLAKSHASDPWGKVAGDLADTAGGLDPSVDANVEGALNVSRRLKGGVEAVEGKAVYIREDGQKISMYLGLVAAKYYEMIFQKGTEVGVAFKATDSETWIYTQTDGKTEHYTKPIYLPAPQLRPPYFGFVSNFDDLKASFTNLTATDLFSTSQGLKDVLKSFTKKGVFPSPPQLPTATASGTVFTWVSPDVMTPTVGRAAITIATDGTVTAIHGGGFDLSDLHYGPASAVTPNPPAMPSGATDDKGAMTPAAIVAAGQSVAVLLSPPPPSTQPTTAPAK